MIGLLSRFDLKVGELALELRDVVLKEAPGANERIFDVYVLALLYCMSDRWSEAFCHITVHKKHVNLGFNRGAELDDPDGLLIGEGKIIRHLKIERRDDLKKPHVRKFIRAAIRRAKELHQENLIKRSRGPSDDAAARKRRHL